MNSLDLVMEPIAAATTVVHVAGELDGGTADHLVACVESIDPAVTTVVLDLAQLTFMDSMGIATLVHLHRDLAAATRRLELRHVREQPYRVLETTELHRVLNLV